MGKTTFHDIIRKDLKEILQVDSLSHNGSTEYQNLLREDVDYTDATNYLNKRYGAKTTDGKKRLAIVKRYAEVLSDKDPIKIFQEESNYISTGGKTEEYTKFITALDNYDSSQHLTERTNQLKEIAESAKDYMQIKGNSKRSTQNGQRRYDLAKNVFEYAQKERERLLVDEVMRYDEAIRSGNTADMSSLMKALRLTMPFFN